MNNQSFNLRECIGVLFLIVFVLAISVPLADTNARSSRRMSNSSQLRGIHQGLVTYANSNKNWFAGLDRNGQYATIGASLPQSYGNQQIGIDIEDRYAMLLDGDYFTPEYAISPYEDDPMIHEWPESGPVTQDNYSYAMLQVPIPGERHEEWQQSLNSEAIVLADRNIGTELDTFGTQSQGHRIQKSTFGCSSSSKLVDHWVGNVLWNDNHVEFIETDSPNTLYGSTANSADNLFNSSGTNDALLIHAGN